MLLLTFWRVMRLTPWHALRQLAGDIGIPADQIDLVVPILQERGLFRREYVGRTLRDHYGLPVPQSLGGRDGALAHTG